MTESQQPPAPELTYDEKLDALMRCVYENNQILNSLLETVNKYLNPSNPGISYPAGYPNPAAPSPDQSAKEFDNRFTENMEYKGAEEDLRDGRTYTHMGNLEQPLPPTHHPPPIPPGGMPGPSIPTEPMTTGVGGEVVMTPAEYREAHGE
tara:strand:+ start:1372 stop:1821 length:450 start_codon:yes stop_codon:yes gene_type:complete